MATAVEAVHPDFTELDGSPLESGYIYIGTSGLDPVTNPITVYWDFALTTPATQPVRTIGGYPSNSGSPGTLFTGASGYSIKTQNKNQVAVMSDLAVDTGLAARVTTNEANIATNTADIATNVTAIGLNTTHRTSSGVDHTFIDQDVKTTATPQFTKAGIGLAHTDGTLHVQTASAGTATANTQADDVVIENNGIAGMSILTPNTDQGKIFWGDPDDVASGQFNYNHADNSFTFATGSNNKMTLNTDGDLKPFSTESQDLGSAALEWDNLYVQNSPTVSDERRKNSISDIENATGLLKALEPVEFKYNDTVIPAQAEVVDKKGNVVLKATPERTITHNRPHTGFIAQQVKEAMTANGLDDWAGYAYSADDDLHSLRLNEFIGVLVAGFKELDARVSALESK